MAGWETMRLAYEARVAVRGELASPKSFPRLIHNNKDDRDKRETHPRTLAHIGTKKKKKKAIVTTLQTKVRGYLSVRG